MVSLAVFAHFDPQGEVSSYVLRHLVQLAEVSDRTVVVTTAPLTESARMALSAHGEVIERSNEGYDFYSWKTGLDAIENWWDADRLILANDSVIGPLIPYRQIIETMTGRGAQFWGITSSREVEPHLQSYVLGFERTALRLPLTRAFWHGLAPLSDRSLVIRQYEIGLSRLMRLAGMTGQSYFRPSQRDDFRARVHRAQLGIKTDRQKAASSSESASNPAPRLARFKSAKFLLPGAAYNPTLALWDSAISGRLPFVKVEALRDDPYQLDHSDRMLNRLSEAWPEAFTGVLEHLGRTEVAYLDLGRGRKVR